MADVIGGPDESARLWRVNRTIHELVKDRVRPSRLDIVLPGSQSVAGLSGVRR